MSVFTDVPDRPSAADRQAGAAQAADGAWDIVGARRGLSLQTLSRMGWRALLGELAVLLVSGPVLHLAVPLLPCLILVGAGVALNLGVGVAAQRTTHPWAPAIVLGAVTLQLGGLLHFTGGVVNPFAVLLIAPAVLAAATTKTLEALGVALLAYAVILALAFWSWDLPWRDGGVLPLPTLYRIACAVALGAGVGFTAAYAWRASIESERMELALNVARSVLTREQQLSALGALAAAAAHELGTPLATIQIVAKEMGRGATGSLKEDAELLVSQAERCREILRRLTETPETDDAMHSRLSLLSFINEVVEPHAGGLVRVEGVVTGPPGAAAPEIRRMPEILHALTTLIDNAADFARSEVLVRVAFDERSISVEVRDDGPGFAADILSRLGQPYVTSRPKGENSRTGHAGMGLGVFIAKTLLERSGAVVHFENARRGGAVVSARWPRDTIEAVPLRDIPAWGGG